MSGFADLSGKIAIVTGGSRGLGRSIALGLARMGVDVVVTSRTLAACEDVAGQIEALGRQALPVACDMGRWQDVDRLAESAHHRFGRCDILVNNAGIVQTPLPLVQTGEEMFDRYYAVNVKGPMHLACLVAPQMAKGGGGSIIHVVTMGALRPGGYLGMYCSSKAAMKALTRVMAEEWAPLGVRVNAIAPGPFRTDMMEELEEATPGFMEHSANVTLLKRMGEPDEIVGSVLFLASDASSYVTGQTLSVDGGAI
jgi:NAD(P)-dependent dehydrogenase (short-subunit alcohol dehydrogenase family)